MTDHRVLRHPALTPDGPEVWTGEGGRPDGDALARQAWAEAEADPGFRDRLRAAKERMDAGHVTPYSEVRSGSGKERLVAADLAGGSQGEARGSGERPPDYRAVFLAARSFLASEDDPGPGDDPESFYAAGKTSDEHLDALRRAVEQVGDAPPPLDPPDYMLTGHECEPVARLVMQEGRDWWLGRLTEPLADWPEETHCLHLATPLKSVVLGVKQADLDQLAVLAFVVGGEHLTTRWIERMSAVFRGRALLEGADPAPQTEAES